MYTYKNLRYNVLHWCLYSNSAVLDYDSHILIMQVLSDAYIII